MILIFIWLPLCFIVAIAGQNKYVGYWGIFFLSLILSPLIGLIIAIVSDTKPTPIRQIIVNHSYLSPQADGLFKSALNKCKKGDHLLAIDEMLRVIPLAPNNPSVYYNLACFYSLAKNKDESFKFLSKCVEKGYLNFTGINSDEDLLWLREQPEYFNFSMEGYKLQTHKTQQ
jgi:hypothetical protein